MLVNAPVHELPGGSQSSPGSICESPHTGGPRVVVVVEEEEVVVVVVLVVVVSVVDEVVVVVVVVGVVDEVVVVGANGQPSATARRLRTVCAAKLPPMSAPFITRSSASGPHMRARTRDCRWMVIASPPETNSRSHAVMSLPGAGPMRVPLDKAILPVLTTTRTAPFATSSAPRARRRSQNT